MKKRLLLLSILASLSLCGCDALDAFFNDDTSTPETKEPEKEDPKDDEDTPSIESISLEGSLEKTSYIVGEKWNLTGLRVDAHYSDKTTSTLDKDEYEFGFSPSSPTLTTEKLTVSARLVYGTLETPNREFDVTVSQKEIKSILINGDFTTKTYAENSNWDPTGLEIVGVLDDANRISLSSDKYTLSYYPSKATYGTTSVSVKAHLKDSTIESENKVINGISVKREYTITFDGNEATSGSMSPVKTTESSYKVPECTFKKTGYTFDGWALNTVGGTKYAVGESIKLSSNITLFATWIEKQASDFDGYYDDAEGKSGTALLNALHTIVNGKSTDGESVNTSYDWSRYESADEDPNNSKNIITIYARTSLAKTAHVSGNKGWNREHTFPDSKMSGGADHDNHIIYASDCVINNARGNIKMGVVSTGSTLKDSYGHQTTCRKTDSLFDPNNLARGIVARTTMYAAAMYNYDPEDNFESIETMLEWHLEYEVDDNDIRRNNVVYGNQHNRNPFVDHPEYACKIWGTTSSKTRQLCGISS